MTVEPRPIALYHSYHKFLSESPGGMIHVCSLNFRPSERASLSHVARELIFDDIRVDFAFCR